MQTYRTDDARSDFILQLFDYDDPGGRAPPQRRKPNTSPTKNRRAAPRAALQTSVSVIAAAQTAQPSVSKSGRKRTLTLRAELAAAAEASENGITSSEAAPPTRLSMKPIISRPSSGAKAQSARPVSNNTQPTVAKFQSKASSPVASTKPRNPTPHMRVKPSVQITSGTALPAPSAAVEVWCENINNLTPGGCISQKYATDSSIRNQIMSDLLCLYFALFRTDVSENLMQHFRMLGNVAAASGADLTKPPPPNKNPAVADLRRAFTTLRYTKHFVKDYNGVHPHPSRPVCFLCFGLQSYSVP